MRFVAQGAEAVGGMLSAGLFQSGREWAVHQWNEAIAEP